MKSTLCLSLWLFISVSAIGQTETAEARITFLMKEAGIPGLSLAVIEDGQLKFTGAYGFRSLDSKMPVNDETIFAAASLSKPIAAYVALQLAEDQKLDLDKPLYRYLPYKDIEGDPRYKRITSRHILSHSSGFPNWRRGELEILFKPGRRFQYSGEGFVYLQKVLEEITGRSLEELAQEMVFEPLGMTHTSYRWQLRFEENYAVPHNEQGQTQKKQKYDEANAAYSLQTTAADYAKFLLAIINDRRLQPETTEQMLAPLVSVTEWGSNPPEINDTISWGLGMGLQQTAKGREFWHWGDNGAFKCYFTASKERGSGLVYFTNSSNGLSITPELAELFTGAHQPAWAWSNYSHFQSPAFRLLNSLAEEDFEVAVKPFLTASADHQDTTLIDEGEMNSLGYFLLRQKRYGEAKKVFGMNLRAFPYAANAYDSYAEACLVSGDRKAAAVYYAKAAGLNPDNKRAKQIVRQLTQPMKGRVEFRLEGYPNARFVSLAGEFNNWDETSNIMRWEDGAWVARLDLEPGEYAYKFVVDGVWILDPANPQSRYEDGHHNSLRQIK